MKKYLYIAIAAATLASCSQDEVMDVAEKEAITFGNAFVGNSTRAIDPSYSNANNKIQSFQLFGTVNNVNIYNDVKVENKKSVDSNEEAGYGNEWYCPVTQYWVSDANYIFAAVVNANKINKDGYGMPTSLEYTLDGTTDMLYNSVTRKNNTAMVEFNFTHLLSKVYFSFVNNMTVDSKYTYKVTDVKITSGLATTGVYTIGATTPWALGTTKTGNLEFGNIGGTAENEAATVLTYNAPTTSKDAKLIIPGNQTLNISYTVELLYNGESVKSETKTASVTHNFAENHVYNISGELQLTNEITFTVKTMNTWSETDEVVEM
jgi:hypothetical protein